VGEGGEKDLENGNNTFLFHVGLRFLVITLVFFCTFNVATLTWPSVGVKPNTWKSWGFGVLRDSRMFRARQQDPKHLMYWGVLGVIGKS